MHFYLHNSKKSSTFVAAKGLRRLVNYKINENYKPLWTIII
jgi:hypothetical protein